MASLWRRRALGPSKKLVDLAIAVQLSRTLRIEPFHLCQFSWGQRGKMTYESNKDPGLPLPFGRSGGPAWHSGPGDSLLDRVEQFAVREILRRGLAQVRSWGVDAATDCRITATVVGV